jgi:hypothetical protein
MRRYFLSIKAFPVALIFILALLSGCGGSGSGNEISVQTGSLSKTAFIKRADAVCASARNRFNAQLVTYGQKNKLPKSSAGQEAWIANAVKEMLLPDYEKMIAQISAIGAPKGDEEQIATFLNALQERLEVIEAQPSEAGKTATPFAKAEKLARSYGLNGCAESLS